MKMMTMFLMHDNDCNGAGAEMVMMMVVMMFVMIVTMASII
jgi:hypothetical protein